MNQQANNSSYTNASNSTVTSQAVFANNLKDIKMTSTASDLINQMNALRLPSNYSVGTGGSKLPQRLYLESLASIGFLESIPMKTISSHAWR